MSKLALKQNGIFEYIQEENLNNVKSELVLVKPISVGICSSDIPRAFSNKAYFYPLVLGHEFSVVVEYDPKNKIKKGTRCVVFPLIPCFKCNSCKSKKYNMCKNYSYYGSRVDGGLQTNLYVNYWNLLKIPNELDQFSSSLIEPISVCIHASNKVTNNSSILIYGGGFLSQILSQLLLLKNCQITVHDRNFYKKKFFDKKVNFLTGIDQLEESSYDFAIECCGAVGILNQCIKFTKPGGIILQMANPSSEAHINSSGISQMMRKEQAIIGTWNSDYRPDDYKLCDWNKAIMMLVQNKLNIKDLISHQSNLKNAKKLFKDIKERRSKDSNLKNYNKAIIHVNI